MISADTERELRKLLRDLDGISHLNKKEKTITYLSIIQNMMLSYGVDSLEEVKAQLEDLTNPKAKGASSGCDSMRKSACTNRITHIFLLESVNNYGIEIIPFIVKYFFIYNFAMRGTEFTGDGSSLGLMLKDVFGTWNGGICPKKEFFAKVQSKPNKMYPHRKELTETEINLLLYYFSVYCYHCGILRPDVFILHKMERYSGRLCKFNKATETRLVQSISKSIAGKIDDLKKKWNLKPEQVRELRTVADFNLWGFGKPAKKTSMTQDNIAVSEKQARMRSGHKTEEGASHYTSPSKDPIYLDSALAENIKFGSHLDIEGCTTIQLINKLFVTAYQNAPDWFKERLKKVDPTFNPKTFFTKTEPVPFATAPFTAGAKIDFTL